MVRSPYDAQRNGDPTGAIVYQVTSVLARCKLSASLPLAAIEERLGRGTEVHGSFLGYRLKSAKTYIAVRRNGFIEARGAPSVDAAVRGLEEARHELATLLAIDPLPFQVELLNIVATFDVGHSVSLAAIFHALDASSASYEPEQFPGMIMDLPHDRGKALLFSSGKVVLTGFRSEENLRLAEVQVRGIIENLGA